MLIEDLFSTTCPISNNQLQILQQQCSGFLAESAALPIYKLLPQSYGDFHKVKVRQHRSSNHIDTVFNNAFDHYSNLRQRAVFVNSQLPTIRENLQPFFIFPINGYKYLYCKEVSNSSDDYQKVLSTLVEQFDDNATAVDFVTDLLKYTYVGNNLTEALTNNCEIILYNIPYYYAVRVSTHRDYQSIVNR